MKGTHEPGLSAGMEKSFDENLLIFRDAHKRGCLYGRFVKMIPGREKERESVRVCVYVTRLGKKKKKKNVYFVGAEHKRRASSFFTRE